MFKVVKSVAKSAAKGVMQDPEVQKIAAKHPRAAQFIKKRLTPDEEFGLHLTIGVLVTALFMYFFFKVLQDLIGQEMLVQADLRIINLLQILRAPWWNHTMLLVTDLGAWQLMFLAVLFVSVALILRSRWHYVIALWVSVGVGEIFLWVVKNVVDRPRPPLTNALLPAEGFSFPSGHAFIAVSFYGLLFYFFWRAAGKGKLRRAAIIVAGLLVILAIGFSRIYLGVHWPSDVLASFASGAAWLTAIITALEINRTFFQRGEGAPLLAKKPWYVVVMVLLAVWVGAWLSFYRAYPLPRMNDEAPQAQIQVQLSDVPAQLFTTLPRYTEGVSGRRIEPINVVLVAQPAQLIDAFRAAGWQVADQVSLHSLANAVRALVGHHGYAQAPCTPTFWQTRSNDYCLEQAINTRSLQERHHLRLWSTPYVTANGARVWVGTAQFDKSISLTSSLYIPTHQIDPAVDKERDTIVKDLVGTGLVDKVQVYQMVEPLLGKNAVGSEFFTDGKADVFFLK